MLPILTKTYKLVVIYLPGSSSSKDPTYTIWIQVILILLLTFYLDVNLSFEVTLRLTIGVEIIYNINID